MHLVLVDLVVHLVVHLVLVVQVQPVHPVADIRQEVEVVVAVVVDLPQLLVVVVATVACMVVAAAAAEPTAVDQPQAVWAELVRVVYVWSQHISNTFLYIIIT
jgi:hypothetical protein